MDAPVAGPALLQTGWLEPSETILEEEQRDAAELGSIAVIRLPLVAVLCAQIAEARCDETRAGGGPIPLPLSSVAEPVLVAGSLSAMALCESVWRATR